MMQRPSIVSVVTSNPQAGRLRAARTDRSSLWIARYALALAVTCSVAEAADGPAPAEAKAK
jgi:hypothetical protein